MYPRRFRFLAVLILCSFGCIDVAIAGEFNRLYSNRAEATSYLKNNWNKYEENYHPHYLLDENEKTAWVERAEGVGVGQSVTVFVSRLTSADAFRIEIRNGYQKSGSLFEKNSRPVEVKVEFLDRGKTHSVSTIKLADKTGWQTFTMNLDKNRAVNAVRFTLQKIKTGSRYKDTCISDLRIFAKSKAPYNAKVEKAKHDALMSWISQRLKKAEYYASLPKPYPFSGTSLVNVSESHDKDANDKYVKTYGNLVAEITGSGKPTALSPKVGEIDHKTLRDHWNKMVALRNSTKWYRGVPRTKFEAPDFQFAYFQWLLEFGMSYLNRDHFSVFETTTPMAFDRKPEQPYFIRDARSNFKAEFAGAKPQSLYLKTTKVYEERGVYSIETEFLLTYDDKGRLSSVLQCMMGEEWEVGYSDKIRLMQFKYLGNKINRIDVVTTESVMTTDYMWKKDGIPPPIVESNSVVRHKLVAGGSFATK